MKASTAKTRGVFEKIPGSGVWWIQYFDADGRRRREKIGSKSAAIKTVEQRRTQAREGMKVPVNLRAKKITFGEIAKAALAWSRANKRDFAHDDYRMPLLIEQFGKCQAEDIKPSEITEWLQSRADWSRATRNRYTALLKMVYRQAEEAEKIKVNPARLVRQRKYNNDRIRYLSDSEEVRLRTVMEKNYADRIPEFEIALMTGMRMSEQLTLEWDEVDQDAGTIHLAQTKNGTSRFVRLNSRALAIMRTLYAHGIGTGRVFIAKRPDWFRAAVREAGIKDFTWHCLRHTFASRLMMVGVDLKTVQDLMGHKSITMTARYTHLSPEHRVAALEKLCQASATTTATEDKSGSKLVAPMVQ
jgi:site-specific recombinase XerD